MIFSVNMMEFQFTRMSMMGRRMKVTTHCYTGEGEGGRRGRDMERGRRRGREGGNSIQLWQLFPRKPSPLGHPQPQAENVAFSNPIFVISDAFWELSNPISGIKTSLYIFQIKTALRNP